MSANTIFSYLKALNEREASDLYLTVGQSPTIRKDATLIPLTKDPLSPDDLNEILNAVLTSRQKREYEASWELNASLDMGEYGRYRINVLRQRQFPALVVRRIISKIPSFQELRLPPVLEALSMEKRGLILISGMTGAGKSSTLAAMIDFRNAREDGHIVTIEDPIEYFHEHKKCIVTQREVGVDTQSYAAALKNALRQRPDVILVGEIREREVMEQAMMSSETGHLCLSTIHSTNTYQTIERVVNLFPEDYLQLIRLNLALNLKAIISQRLLPSVGGFLVPVHEVMLNQGLVRELILRGEITKIREVMEQTNAIGMITFDQSILKLYQDGVISEEVALAHADRQTDMKIKLNQINYDRQRKNGKSDSAKAKGGSPLLTLKD